MPFLKRMTNPKFCYHSCCLKTSCNMQHDVDNLLVSVLETMTFYRGANLIFSSQFSDMCSVVHLTVLTVSAIMFWDFVPFSLSKLHQLEAFSMTFSLKHLEFCLFTIHGIWVIKDCSSISKLGNCEILILTWLHSVFISYTILIKWNNNESSLFHGVPNCNPKKMCLGETDN
jgi:hypothetical protein